MPNVSVEHTATELLIDRLNLIEINMGRYLYPFIFSLGNIGCILNILILTQRVYLQSSCSCYILASSITNLFIVNIDILFHMLSFGFGIDPTTTSLYFCRFRQYVSHVTTLLSRIYIVLACIDRWAMTSTSVKLRSYSKVNVAKIIIPSVAIVWFIISLHIPWHHFIVNGRCMVILRDYSIFYNIYNTVLSVFFIPIIMIIFGFLTIRHVKLSRQRVNPRLNRNPILISQQQVKVNVKSREYEILIMILVQLAVYLITCLPFPMYLLCSTVTISWIKSNVQLALDRFYSNITVALNNINFSATFYIYILTTRVFRKDLKRLFVENRLFKIYFAPRWTPTPLKTNNGTIGTIAVTMNQQNLASIQCRR
ncbi:unnamed protein product [Rotaria socialis]|uniref:G-protein coupled receptors family 1 profile domain-containing protein n=2 Tax=Rotaria socialis TaxID=392032 RepID=A0A817V447_9BILA|nr:unnamed protein product [Rotaria socialis]CAF3663734.1 unnamed protein product [Rotaria socialis]CAF4194226.1 unnamed protein product [Rotaria socialis]CAF4565257.1 unnamed protein product [Rotaria socialis]CAF4737447.1 unnamed protein product [Rotaria socialis]